MVICGLWFLCPVCKLGWRRCGRAKIVMRVRFHFGVRCVLTRFLPDSRSVLHHELSSDSGWPVGAICGDRGIRQCLPVTAMKKHSLAELLPHTHATHLGPEGVSPLIVGVARPQDYRIGLLRMRLPVSCDCFWFWGAWFELPCVIFDMNGMRARRDTKGSTSID